jgi:light-regulated signal transduction histidine kinase (bacteriophytochrome)
MGTRREGATADLHVQLAALRSVPAGCVIAVDPQLRALLASGDALADLGLPRDRAEGRPLAELMPPERWTLWEPALQTGLRGQPASFDVEGSGRLYRVQTGPWRDAEGTIIGGLAVATDISDSGQAAESLASELEAFNYSVSHDLRAPLRAIDGFSAAVVRRNGAALDDAGRDLLARIRRAVANMGTLIDALLELSRLSRREMGRDRVDLSELARGVADDLRARDPERTVAFVVEDGLSAVGDRELLRIALENLFENAWKFTAGRENARIEFVRTQRDGRPVFAVRDNGAGFDMAVADRLFAPFQRLHSDEEFPGLGVGLATVQRIIRRHSGTICGEGRVGEGATFSFELRDATGGER